MASKLGGSAARFGPRYGKSLKAKFAAIEDVQRSKQLCPYCGRAAVKRLAAGIWQCRKCCSKFAGRAYKAGE